MHFNLELDRCVNIGLNLASAHGVCDVDQSILLLLYVFALLPWTGLLTTLAFIASSVVHFGQDFGLRSSSIIHFFLLYCYHCIDKNVAFSVVTAYSACVHTPLLFWRLLMNHRYFSFISTLLASAAAVVVRPFSTSFCLTHLMQKLIVMHVAIQELKLGTTKASAYTNIRHFRARCFMWLRSWLPSREQALP